jgi:peptidoglycan/xylan/chitin deacetylase (PgdA/CDA1 family)
MSPWKGLLLTLYYGASQPLRKRRLACAVAAGQAPLAVLFYHRVADDQATPWTVSNRLFARQIAWLQDHCELISLEETQRRIRLGHNPRMAASITFDDGYAENCHQALPLLIARRIPCTYFVTLENVVENRPFQHDLVRGRPAPPNTIEELRAMAAGGIEIGAHTWTHSDLATIGDPRQMHRELVESGRELARVVGRPVRYFAFPFGQRRNLCPAAFALARRAGYEAVCSAYGGYNFPGDDPFHLQRIGVNADLIGLKNWLTFDPRKLRIPRYE